MLLQLLFVEAVCLLNIRHKKNLLTLEKLGNVWEIIRDLKYLVHLMALVTSDTVAPDTIY